MKGDHNEETKPGDKTRDNAAPKDGVDKPKKHKRSEDDQKTKAREGSQKNGDQTWGDCVEILAEREKDRKMKDAAKSSEKTGLEIVPFTGTPEKKKRKTASSGVSTTASSAQEDEKAKQNVKNASRDKRAHNGSTSGCTPEKKKLKFGEDSSEGEAENDDEACIGNGFICVVVLWCPIML